MINDILFQNIIGHTERFVTLIEIFLSKVITVIAIKIAHGTDGFYKDLKCSGCFRHIKCLSNPLQSSNNNMFVVF